MGALPCIRRPRGLDQRGAIGPRCNRPKAHSVTDKCPHSQRGFAAYPRRARPPQNSFLPQLYPRTSCRWPGSLSNAQAREHTETWLCRRTVTLPWHLPRKYCFSTNERSLAQPPLSPALLMQSPHSRRGPTGLELGFAGWRAARSVGRLLLEEFIWGHACGLVASWMWMHGPFVAMLGA